MGRSDLGKEGIVGRDKNGSMDVVRGMMKGVGMRDRENGEGGEGGGTIVESSGECIDLPIGCTLPVSDLVVVCCRSGSPPEMSSGCRPGCRKVL